MDNPPKDPPDSGNNPIPISPVGNPPPFGSNFNSHTNPVDPNNPYLTQPQPNPVPPPSQTPDPNTIKHEHYSEAAQNKPRDEHGHFKSNSSQAPLIHTNPDPQTPIQPGQTPPNPSNTPNPSFLPPIIEINQNTKPSDKEDPPLFGFFLTNPVTYLRKFLQKLLKRQMITLRIPVLALIVIMVGIGGFGVGFQSGLNYAVGKLFPNFSPILHRSITAQGIIQKSTKGYYLQANDKNKTMWTLMPKSQNVNLADFENMKVEVKGNLTPTPNLIEVSEVVSFEPKPTPAPTIPVAVPPNIPNLPNIPNQDLLPQLYSGLQWDLTQRKVLLFTSGKRRIEQEGVYLESAQVETYPQEFIDYYTNQLSGSGFKQTFNSSDPNGTTITYAKDELFLTYGVKNIYSGSGDNKKLVGYKAFIEHN
ncbi:MAG: hypothetical protein ABIC96_02025 [Patescibacteria group bacterium]